MPDPLSQNVPEISVTQARHACLAAMRQRSRVTWIDTIESIRECVYGYDTHGRQCIAALLGRTDRNIAIFQFLYLSELTKIYASRRAENHNPFFLADPYADNSDFGFYRGYFLPPYYLDCHELHSELQQLPQRNGQSNPRPSEIAKRMAESAKPMFDALAEKIEEEQRIGHGPERARNLEQQRLLTHDLMELFFCENEEENGESDNLKLIHKLRLFLFHMLDWDRQNIPTETVIAGQLARVRGLMGDCCLDCYRKNNFPASDAEVT